MSTKIVPVYSPLDWTSFTVTMYNETKTTPVAISGNVRFFIFQKKKDGVERKYSNYKNDTIIRSGLMDPTGRTGEFRATFSRLPAGDYAIFRDRGRTTPSLNNRPNEQPCPGLPGRATKRRNQNEKNA